MPSEQIVAMLEQDFHMYMRRTIQFNLGAFELSHG